MDCKVEYIKMRIVNVKKNKINARKDKVGVNWCMKQTRLRTVKNLHAGNRL